MVNLGDRGHVAKGGGSDGGDPPIPAFPLTGGRSLSRNDGGADSRSRPMAPMAAADGASGARGIG